MSNNQQVSRKKIISQNMAGNNSVSYGQSGQQQPLYYDQNQIMYPGAENKQQTRQIEQPSIPYQVPPIPQISKQYNYQQIPQQIIHQQKQNQNIHQQVTKNIIYPKNQYQNIYNQAPQQNIYQQNQNQSLYPDQFISPQQIQQNKKNPTQLVTNNQIIKSNIPKKEVLLDDRGGLIAKKETDELYSYESAICKIKIQNIKNGEITYGVGTGFFCEIDDKNIPFKTALFTNNHILDEKKLEINKEIIFEICNKLYKIKITNNRKVFTNKMLDYTCIEIFDSDNIKKFFKIDDNIFNNKKV